MKRKSYEFDDFFELYTMYGDKFFGKVLYEKILIDAEVLMSAIYDKMGVKTPMYLPFMQRREMGVVSESVDAFDSTAKTIAQIQDKQGAHIYNQFYIRNLISNPDMQKMLTKNAINDIVTMTNLDIASRNTDRSSFNLFLGDKQADGRFNSGISIDYGSCADRYAKFRHGLDDYYINIGKVGRGRYQYIAQMCAIEDWYGFVTPKEFITKLDGINVREIAREIRETYGYEIDSRYINYVQDSYRDFIETTNDFLNFNG